MVIDADVFFGFLKKIQREKLEGFQSVIVPVENKRNSHPKTLFSQLVDNCKLSLDIYRSIDPVKIYFYSVRQKVFPFTGDNKKYLIAGVKACDIQALDILDRALLRSGFIDPAYAHWRESITIISTDCMEISEYCHCNLTGGHPYPEKGFDINLSKLGNKYFITVGSPKGEIFMDLMKKHIPINNLKEEDVYQVWSNRKSVVALLEKQNHDYTAYSSESFEKLEHVTSDKWKENSKECVGCTACTNICPTCYCMILNDESQQGNFVKVRSYDSCQLHGYAKVAGGGTPRPKVADRFRNRYLCKFVYMKKDFDVIGCTGCGRCIECEPSGYSIKKVIQTILSEEKYAESL